MDRCRTQLSLACPPLGVCDHLPVMGGFSHLLGATSNRVPAAAPQHTARVRRTAPKQRVCSHPAGALQGRGGGCSVVLEAPRECNAAQPDTWHCAAGPSVGPAAFTSDGTGASRRGGLPQSGGQEAGVELALVPSTYDWRRSPDGGQHLKEMPLPPEGIADDPRVHNPRARTPRSSFLLGFRFL